MRKGHRVYAQIDARHVWAYAGDIPIRKERDLSGYRVGQTVVHHAAAPGTGRTVYRVCLIDEKGVWGRVVMSTVRELEPWETR